MADIGVPPSSHLLGTANIYNNYTRAKLSPGLTTNAVPEAHRTDGVAGGLDVASKNPLHPGITRDRGFAYRVFLFQCTWVFAIAASARISANPSDIWKNFKSGFCDPAKPVHPREGYRPRQDHPGRPVRWQSRSYLQGLQVVLLIPLLLVVLDRW